MSQREMFCFFKSMFQRVSWRWGYYLWFLTCWLKCQLVSSFPAADTFWIHKEGCFIDWSRSYCHWIWLKKWTGGTSKFLLLYSFSPFLLPLASLSFSFTFRVILFLWTSKMADKLFWWHKGKWDKHSYCVRLFIMFLILIQSCSLCCGRIGFTFGGGWGWFNDARKKK